MTFTAQISFFALPNPGSADTDTIVDVFLHTAKLILLWELIIHLAVTVIVATVTNLNFRTLSSDALTPAVKGAVLFAVGAYTVSNQT
jgi:hypothetical protein